MNEIERLKTGICPFTKKTYDCGRCEEYAKLEFHKGQGTFHLNLCIDGPLADGKRGMRYLHRLVGGKKVCTIEECADYFWEVYRNGATRVPVGECDRFCYRRGCMGHATKEGRDRGDNVPHGDVRRREGVHRQGV